MMSSPQGVTTGQLPATPGEPLYAGSFTLVLPMLRIVLVSLRILR